MPKNHSNLFEKIINQLNRKVARDLNELVYLQSSTRFNPRFVDGLLQKMQRYLDDEINHWYANIPVIYLSKPTDVLPQDVLTTSFPFITIILYGSSLCLQRGWPTALNITYWDNDNLPKNDLSKNNLSKDNLSKNNLSKDNLPKDNLSKNDISSSHLSSSHLPHLSKSSNPSLHPTFTTFVILQTQEMFFVNNHAGAMDQMRYRLWCNPKQSHPFLVANHSSYKLQNCHTLSTGDPLYDCMKLAKGSLDGCVLPVLYTPTQPMLCPFFAGVALLVQEAGGKHQALQDFGISVFSQKNWHLT